MGSGFVIAGTSSGSGKTTLSLALMAALAERGFQLAPFKVGPDFIDPGHHTRITGVISRNLDGWMLSNHYNQTLFDRCSGTADMAVVEGVMGLFDGYGGGSEAGSTAQMAKWLDLPVLLIVDARSMARSAAALVQGFERFDPDLCFAGVIFNRIGSPRHLAYLREALEEHVDMPCLGGIPREGAISIPERHLGLHTADDHPLSENAIRRLSKLVEEHVALDSLIEMLPKGPKGKRSFPTDRSYGSTSVRIAVAKDQVFCFYYQDNLEFLQEQGAEIVYFSPLTDHSLPSEVDGLYLGGGYPELQAKKLSKNRELRIAIRHYCQMGMPIYAECGGFMYLCDRLTDLYGQTFPMCGCFPFGTRMLKGRKALGYREIRLTGVTPLGPVGLVARGHEFHYSELSERDADVAKMYAVASRKGAERLAEGYMINNTLASYIHLHFGSNPAMARHFVENCHTFQKERMPQT